jgi:hypothetical protein
VIGTVIVPVFALIRKGGRDMMGEMMVNSENLD